MEDGVVIGEKQAAHRKLYEGLRLEKFARGILYSSTLRAVFHRKKENQLRREVRDPNAPPVLAVLLRCDVEGSLEAILNVISTYHGNEVKLDVVDFDVGSPTENDLVLANDFDGPLSPIPAPLHPRLTPS